MARRLRSFWFDQRGQDMIEYAMLAGFICVTMGILMPTVILENLNRIYSRVGSVLVTIGGA
jgi:Flp pilus assembly pilin Flp